MQQHFHVPPKYKGLSSSTSVVSMETRKAAASLLIALRRKLWRLCLRIRWLIRKRPRPKVVIRRLGRLSSGKGQPKGALSVAKSSANVVSYGNIGFLNSKRPFRIATFNVAMFSLAPAVSKSDESSVAFAYQKEDYMDSLNGSFRFDVQPKSPNQYPKSILKQSPLNTPNRSKHKVSINLPENEISLAQSKILGLVEDSKEGSPINQSNVIMRSPVCLSSSMMMNYFWNDQESLKCGRSIAEVLKEVGADILALQDVKAVEERGMKPLSDLAAALGMKFVFAESWAPEYGNAILSKWPIKKWMVQKIADDDDFRNVLKATIDVPGAGEVNFYCTQLDHLDEKWRTKQIRAIIESSNSSHILLGGLNSLDGSDYSSERWTDIVKYYEDIGKPTPRVEVTKFLKEKEYTDAKYSAGECEPVVIIAKGQNVQGTCKYGTRVDYVLASPESPYKFVPGSYSVISSKGTSDHHIVKVDVVKQENVRTLPKPNHKVVQIANSGCSGGKWKITP